MESKTNFSRRLKQFDGLTCLTLQMTSHILRQISATVCMYAFLHGKSKNGSKPGHAAGYNVGYKGLKRGARVSWAVSECLSDLFYGASLHSIIIISLRCRFQLCAVTLPQSDIAPRQTACRCSWSNHAHCAVFSIRKWLLLHKVAPKIKTAEEKLKFPVLVYMDLARQSYLHNFP